MVSVRIATRVGSWVLATSLVAGCSLVNDPAMHTGTSADAAIDAPVPPPRVRIAHLSRDTENVDVLVDGTAVARGVAFTSVSTPADLGEGMHTFRVQTASDGTMLVERAFETSAGQQYTLTLYGDRSTPPFPERTLELLLLDDDASGLDTTRDMRLSVVHVASPVIAGQLVSVTDTGNTLLADDFAFAGVAPLTLPSRPYVVGFDAGADGILDVDFDVPALVPGTYANVFVAARTDGGVFLLVSTSRGATQIIEPN